MSAAKLAHGILRLAIWLAGSERANWTAAMAAEADAAGPRGTAWALGCLRAVIVDRLNRERWFLLGLFTMPALALLIIVPLAFASFFAARQLGFPPIAFVPIFLFGPLPCAWLLGRMRPVFSWIAVGTIGFLVHQSVPLLIMCLFFGVVPVGFWSPNMTYYNMPATIGLAASWLVWIGGTWWGSISRHHHERNQTRP